VVSGAGTCLSLDSRLRVACCKLPVARCLLLFMACTKAQ